LSTVERSSAFFLILAKRVPVALASSAALPITSVFNVLISSAFFLILAKRVPVALASSFSASPIVSVL
jgi:hypothetical protein